jgi:energy-coupling factor transporter ATP-binding protein EcfA2
MSSTDIMSLMPPSSSGEGLLPAKKINDSYSSNIRRIILIGLEGVGKTTLINDLTGTNFETSAGKHECNLEDEQIGSFSFEQYQIDLIDMIGINCKDPGQWQKQLQERSDVHGVIFYVNGSNGRQSALGDLPRFADYCRNLAIPMLFFYRTGELDYFANHGESFEVISEYEKTTDQIEYQNLNLVKKKIVDEFKSHTKLHILIDSMECCKQINELKRENQYLQQEVNTLHHTVGKLQQKLAKLRTYFIDQSVKYDKRLHERKDSHASLGMTRRQSCETLITDNCELTYKIAQLVERNDTKLLYIIMILFILILLSASILFVGYNQL